MKIAVIAVTPPAHKRAKGIQQPSDLPTFRCRPDRVSGIPVFLENFCFIADNPLARFQDHENPNLLFRRPIAISLQHVMDVDR